MEGFDDYSMKEKLIPRNGNRFKTTAFQMTFRQAITPIKSDINQRINEHTGRTIVNDPELIINIIGSDGKSKHFSKIQNDVTNKLFEITKNAWLLTNSKQNFKSLSGMDVIEIGISNDNNLRKDVFAKCGKLKCVLIIGGTDDTLKDVVKMMEENIPVILIKSSGGLADLISNLITKMHVSMDIDEDKIVESTLKSMTGNASSGFDQKLLKRCLLTS